ncbi:MAG: U32 family peptidase C-terminal domain-containing protein, partial [Spirochaetaceae bacterium]|nr:U32 family peptidase C-terminal domain-containing protein [Spirochaetaceae bacterium]
YAAIVTGAYRHVLDDVAAGRPIDPVWRDEVEKISHRHYSTGFYYGQPGQYYEDSRYVREYQVVAVVNDCDESGLARCSLRNKFSAGEELEAVGPDLRPFALNAGELTTAEGETVGELRTPQSVFTMRLPKPVPAWTILRRRVDLSAR